MKLKSNKISSRLIYWIFLPLSLLYRLVVFIRNKLFDYRILESEKFSTPIICVGNLSVGGTGKTPHIEYLIEQLQHKHRIALVSRGYGRNSKGQQTGTSLSSASDIGDEPLQIFRKYPDTLVVVDGNRRQAIRFIEKNHPQINLILMDDGFQHRYVQASCYLLLTPFETPYFADTLLPAGRLREPSVASRRAQIVIVSKSPTEYIDTQSWSEKLNIQSHQSLFFSTIAYSHLVNVYQADLTLPLDILKNYHTLIISGIANDQLLVQYISSQSISCQALNFPDHHVYSSPDEQKILGLFEKMPKENSLIITTEKDAVKLRVCNSLRKTLASQLFYLPLKVQIAMNKAEDFAGQIKQFISQYR